MNPPENNNALLKYLALGDSYTIGEGVADQERWPHQLVQKLSQNAFIFEQITIVAETGWTTQDLLSAMDERKLDRTFDLVSLLIGVNNQYQGKIITDYARDFEHLLRTSVALAAGKKDKIFVLSIPDYSVTPFAASKDTLKIASEIKAFNQINNQITKTWGIKYFDITPLSVNAKIDTSLLAEDKLHPSGKMYEEWVEFIYPEIAGLLR